MFEAVDPLQGLRSVFAGSDRFGQKPFCALTRSYKISQDIVRYFYFASAFFLWMRIPRLHQIGVSDPQLELVWPLLWMSDLPLLPIVDVVAVSSASLAVLAFWKPQNWIFRAAFAVTFLMCAAIPASTGAINHGFHEWFWIAFVFVFLPNAEGRRGRLAYSMTFATAQALVLLFYTMAGTWKLLFGMTALMSGRPGNFSPEGLAWTVADRMMQTGTQPLLGPFIIENYWAAMPMFLILLYAQLMSIFVAFRPTLHIIWGGLLIAFHTGTFLLMEIAFPTHIAILMLFFVMSPFQRSDWFAPQTLLKLPLLGNLLDIAARLSIPAMRRASV